MKHFIIGLVASDKTTLYRKLNEEKTSNAVEIELPQSCINDEDIKRQLFNIFYQSKNIDTIIAHPYYLPKDFWELINDDDKIEVLSVPKELRIERSLLRSKSCQSDCKIFDNDFFGQEEVYLSKFMQRKESK